MEVVYIEVDKLKPYFRNPRINVKTAKALRVSIERYGFNVPVVVDTNNVLVTGHARFMAAKYLQLEEVPAIIMDADNKLVKEFRIKDNRVHDLTEWNEEELEKQLKDLPSFAYAMEEFKGLLDDGMLKALEEPIEEEYDPEAEYYEPREENPDKQHGDPVNLIECPFCGEMTEKGE